MTGASALEVSLNGPLTRDVIVGLKTRALRRRVWFGALDRIERGLVDLTIRYVDQVKSNRLRQVLVEILEKLARALESSMVRILEKGSGLALRLSELAAAGEISWPLNGVTIQGSIEHWASEFSPTGHCSL